MVVQSEQMILPGRDLLDISQFLHMNRFVYLEFACPSGRPGRKHVHGSFLLHDFEGVQGAIGTDHKHSFASEADLLNGGWEGGHLGEVSFSVGLLTDFHGGNFGLGADV